MWRVLEHCDSKILDVTDEKGFMVCDHVVVCTSEHSSVQILVNMMMSQERLEGISSSLEQTFTWIQGWTDQVLWNWCSGTSVCAVGAFHFHEQDVSETPWGNFLKVERLTCQSSHNSTYLRLLFDCCFHLLVTIMEQSLTSSKHQYWTIRQWPSSINCLFKNCSSYISLPSSLFWAYTTTTW